MLNLLLQFAERIQPTRYIDKKAHRQMSVIEKSASPESKTEDAVFCSQIAHIPIVAPFDIVGSYGSGITKADLVMSAAKHFMDSPVPCYRISQL